MRTRTEINCAARDVARDWLAMPDLQDALRELRPGFAAAMDTLAEAVAKSRQDWNARRAGDVAATGGFVDEIAPAEFAR